MADTRRTLRGRVALWCAIAAVVTIVVFGIAAYVVVWLEESAEVREGIVAGPAEPEARRLVLVAMLVAAPIALAIVVLGARWLARRALEPLDEVIAAARRITTSDLAQRLDVPAAPGVVDELHRLVDELNGLLGRLEEGFSALALYAADASHELRTPLAVIASELEVALRRPRDAKEWEASARTVLDEVRRLARLVEALLAMARAERASPPTAAVDLRDVVNEAVAAAGARAKAAGLSLTVLADRSAPARGDADALAAAVGALLDNAVRYTPHGGRIEVAVHSAGDEPSSIQVDDSGPGVPPAERDSIFVPFRRGAAAKSNDGVGLGLSIARRIALRHGGDITVASSPLGGSRFTITLQRAAG